MNTEMKETSNTSTKGNSGTYININKIQEQTIKVIDSKGPLKDN